MSRLAKEIAREVHRLQGGGASTKEVNRSFVMGLRATYKSTQRLLQDLRAADRALAKAKEREAAALLNATLRPVHDVISKLAAAISSLEDRAGDYGG